MHFKHWVLCLMLQTTPPTTTTPISADRDRNWKQEWKVLRKRLKNQHSKLKFVMKSLSLTLHSILHLIVFCEFSLFLCYWFFFRSFVGSSSFAVACATISDIHFALIPKIAVVVFWHNWYPFSISIWKCIRFQSILSFDFCVKYISVNGLVMLSFFARNSAAFQFRCKLGVIVCLLRIASHLENGKANKKCLCWWFACECVFVCDTISSQTELTVLFSILQHVFFLNRWIWRAYDANQMSFLRHNLCSKRNNALYFSF